MLGMGKVEDQSILLYTRQTDSVPCFVEDPERSKQTKFLDHRYWDTVALSVSNSNQKARHSYQRVKESSGSLGSVVGKRKLACGSVISQVKQV